MTVCGYPYVIVQYCYEYTNILLGKQRDIDTAHSDGTIVCVCVCVGGGGGGGGGEGGGGGGGGVLLLQ